MGNDITFKETTILFYILGAEFGTSYSMTKINLLDWMNTKPILKILRVLLGLVFCIIVEYTVA